MANEAKFVYGSQATLEANGGSIASGAIGTADDLSYSTTQTADFPDAVFALMVNYSVAPTADKSIDLFLVPQDIDSTNDAQDVTTTFLRYFYGAFVPKAQTGAQYIYLEAFNIPKGAKAMLYNNATGQTIPAGWTLKMTPRSIGPS